MCLIRACVYMCTCVRVCVSMHLRINLFAPCVGLFLSLCLSTWMVAWLEWDVYVCVCTYVRTMTKVHACTLHSWVMAGCMDVCIGGWMSGRSGRRTDGYREGWM